MTYIPPTESTSRTACWDVRRDPVPGTQIGVTVQLDDPWPIALAGRVELGFDAEDARRLAVALHSASIWVADRSVAA